MGKEQYPDEDRDLVARCRKGDPLAFEELVRKHQQMVLNLAYHYLGYHNDIEDVAQKIFIKVYFSLPKFDTRRPFFPWLYRIAINQCYDELRRLRRLKIRLGRPKPFVNCSWPKERRDLRIRRLFYLLLHARAGEVWVFEDEVDIHLNPKIGPDWMLMGQQKTVATPGQNQKRYLAGALDARTGKLTWVEGERKNSTLFLLLIHRLVTVSYRKARRIHIILDNLSAHKTQAVRQFLAHHPRVHLHFTPTYSSWLNQVELWFGKIERDVIARGVFTSVPDLARKLRRYINAYSANARPIQWKYSDPTHRIRTNDLSATGH